jgi:hypothetical protein
MSNRKDVNMLKNISRLGLTVSWCAVIVVLFAVSVVLGANVSAGASEMWLLVCFAPPVVMLFVWRAPTQTVAELLYAVNHPDRDGRR